ncbi:MAG: noncanonical pyrimidine nucleotidase, YjjG family [Cytophagales bacterium]|nr:MAG: noncanonical pyrimidine nucleotidase, YjjG family [Cytophagales bacterium]
MKNYKHIIFDLDHTLWDFDSNCKLALEQLYLKYEFDKINSLTIEEFLKKYIEVNTRLWDQHHRGLESKETIRNKRFIYTFEELGLSLELIPENLNADFMKLCPTMGQLIPGAMELLNYLKPKYQLHILSNGFLESQYVKMKYAHIDYFFTEVVLAEACGYAKPQKEIFEYTLTKIGGSTEDSIMVGDDLMVDILGAKNAGLNQIYYNRYNQPHKEEIFYETNDLSTLKDLL